MTTKTISAERLAHLETVEKAAIAVVTCRGRFHTEQNMLRLYDAIGKPRPPAVATWTETDELQAQCDRLLAALNLIETDKDGDGFVCREAMVEVRKVISCGSLGEECPP